jgi:hypothetical protein
VFFGIEEPIRKVVVQKPRVPNPTDRWDYDETISYEPGGKLALCIHSDTPSGEREERKRWSDAKVQRVESRIADLVADSCEPLSPRGVERRSANGMRPRKKSAHERAQRAERMRRFIAAYAEKSSSWSVEKQPKYKAWMEWATQQADRADPFVSEKPPSVLDRKNELSRW